jgi:hypothetical protein
MPQLHLRLEYALKFVSTSVELWERFIDRTRNSVTASVARHSRKAAKRAGDNALESCSLVKAPFFFQRMAAALPAAARRLARCRRFGAALPRATSASVLPSGPL